jgi:chaperonin GroEL
LYEEIKQVATISAESAELGAIIADTIKKVGKDGVVTVEESQSTGLESEIVEGIQFDKGYVSPYMITNPERMESEFNDPHILVTDKKISSIKEVLPLLEQH